MMMDAYDWCNETTLYFLLKKEGEVLISVSLSL